MQSRQEFREISVGPIGKLQSFLEVARNLMDLISAVEATRGN